jgi:hypothetical protein
MAINTQPQMMEDAAALLEGDGQCSDAVAFLAERMWTFIGFAPVA